MLYIVPYHFNFVVNIKRINTAINIVWKVSKYGVFSGPYFRVFEVNTENYASVLSPNTGK